MLGLSNKSFLQNHFLKLNLLIHIPSSLIVAIMLRPSKDDWSNLSALRSIPISLSNLDLIVTNEWCCGFQKRLFFLSWIPQWFIAHSGSSGPRILMVCLALVLYSIGFLTGKILFSQISDARISLLAGFAASSSSVSVVVGSIGNNLFFTLPILWILILILNLMAFNPTKSSFLHFMSFTSILILVQFSGESTFLVGYLICFAFLILNRQDFRKVKIIIFSCGTSLLVMFLYLKIVSGPTPDYNFSALRNFPDYLLSLLKQQVLMLNVFGRGYPDFPEQNWFALGVYLSLIPILMYSVKQIRYKLADSLNKLNLKVSLTYASFTLLALFLPLAYGIVSGLRPGPELRYHLPFFMIFFTIACYLLFKTKLKNQLKQSCFVVIVLLIALTSFAATNGRIAQSEVDDMVWQRIQSLATSPLEVIVTFNPYANYPMPPYHSLAESDFHADWGIGGYITWKSRSRVEIFKNFICEGSKSKRSCVGEYYYGGSKTYKAEVLRSTIFVYSDYVIDTPLLDSTQIQVSDSYDEYRKFVNDTCSKVECRP